MRLFSLLLACCLGLAAGTAAAQAGSVGRLLLVIGDVRIMQGGSPTPVQTGTRVSPGNRVVVGEGSAHVRFDDGATIALRPQTEFVIEEYTFAGREDGKESAVFGLVKGGMRTITGLIGRTNRDNFKVRTATATVGIRGTHFVLFDCPPPQCATQTGRAPDPVILAAANSGDAPFTLAQAGLGGGATLLGGVSDGIIIVTPNLQTIPAQQFGANQFFQLTPLGLQQLIGPPSQLYAPTFTPPTAPSGDQGGTGGGTLQNDGRSAVQATVPPSLVQKLEYTKPTELSSSGNSSLLPSSSSSSNVSTNPPKGWLVIFPLSGSVFAVSDDDLRTPSVFNGLNQLMSFGPSSGGFSGSLAGGQMVDTGGHTIADGTVLTWGTWIGPNVVSSSSATASNVPVLWGAASRVGETSANYGIVKFTYVGGPSPRDLAGNVGQMQSSTVTLDFGQQTFQASLGMLFPSIAGYGSASISASGSGTRAAAGSAVDYTGSISGFCTGPGCGPGHTGAVAFGIGGTTGYDFGVLTGYLTDMTMGGTVLFLNAYQGGGLTIPVRGAVTWGTGSSFDLFALDAVNSHSATISNGQLLGYTANSGSRRGAVDSGSFVETGGDVAAGNMRWGRWTGNSSVTNSSGVSATGPITGVHYIFGDYTPTMPTTGSGTFTYVGGPNPVNGSGAVGTFSAGSFIVNFAARTLTTGTPLTFSVAGSNYTLGGSGSYISATQSTVNGSLSGACTGPCGGSASGSFTGNFFGQNATGLGIVGSVSSSAPTVHFAAGFKR